MSRLTGGEKSVCEEGQVGGFLELTGNQSN